MDEIARYNIERWKALTKADALFTRPYLNLDTAAARARIDPEGRLGEIVGKDVLLLAGGGGQQSAAFALLGAKVTVVDLSEEQLQRDRQVAAHYHVEIKTRQGDMRDLSLLGAGDFDIVWQPYSINFVPDVRAVFAQVARVLRREGIYYFNCANPFFGGLTERDWNGEGYLLKQPYRDGAEMTCADSAWVCKASESVPNPREYRHTLGALVNGLIEQGFEIRHLSDSTDFSPDLNAMPGTWEHFTAIAPPWLTFWAVFRPAAAGRAEELSSDHG
ncbi:MAG: class I SAM-dependent methyltransferase [Chloroflexota bacterium]